MNSPENSFPCRFRSAMDIATDARTVVISRPDYAFFTAEYILSGAGFLEINGRSFHPEADSVYFLQKGSRHCYWPDPKAPWHKVFFQLSGPLTEELLQIYGLRDVYWIPQAKELRGFFESFLHLNMAAVRINERAAVLFHEFAEACAELLSRPKNRIPECVLALRKEMENSLNEKFVLADYCRKQNLSTSYLIRAFRKVYGCAPLEYLLDRRCETARRLLRFSELSIKEIAAQLNFTDQYHFSNFMHRRTGKSPISFRRGL